MKPMEPVRAHKAAAVFPMLPGEQLDALADDIAQNGQREPIVLLDGEILDGRNRFDACQQACIEPRFRDATDEERADPIGFVVSKNLHRRHMDESARAMAAARLREIACHNNDKHSFTVRAAAAALNVSHNAVAQAAHVLADAAPELVAAVDAGKVAVSAAAALTKLPAEEQREAAADPKVARTKAKERREERKPKDAPRADVFVCPECGEEFRGVKVWHCRQCGAHYDVNMDREECGDCHAPRKPNVISICPRQGVTWSEPAALRSLSDAIKNAVSQWKGTDRKSLVAMLRERANQLEAEDERNG